MYSSKEKINLKEFDLTKELEKNQEYLGPTTINLDELEWYKELALSQNGGSGISSTTSKMYNGIRIFGQGISYAEPADDLIGLCFVTRPMLNLCDSNLLQNSKLASLLGGNMGSIRSQVRGLLDRTFGSYLELATNGNFNNKTPWISLITNTLKSSSGFKDLDIEISTTQPGFRKEVYQYVDGYLEENGSFSISQSYQNIKGNILPYIFEIWLEYISEVSTNEAFCPNYDALFQRWIDYDCRIYHLIMNRDMKHIEHIHHTIQSIPNTYPTGSLSDITSGDSKRAGGQDEFNMTFSSVGYRFNSWDCIDAFNYTTYLANPDLKPNSEWKRPLYEKLKSNELLHFQYNAIPLINKENSELEWYVKKEAYDTYKNIELIKG